MATQKTTTRQQFDGIYSALERSLEALRNEGTGAEVRVRMIDAIRGSITAVQTSAGKFTATRTAEIQFFREIWPRFYGLLFFEIRVHQCEMSRLGMSRSGQMDLLRSEESRVALFFRKHREFCLYYRSGSSVIDDQFTREYSRARAFDPLAFVIDPQGGTVASYQAAWCIAFDRYAGWLAHQKDILRGSDQPTGSRLEWRESKSAAVQLITAQAEKGSIYIDGRKATASELKAEFERQYNCDLKDYDQLLYATDTLKKDATPYLSALIGAFLGRKSRLRK
jgi:RteC protein